MHAALAAMQSMVALSSFLLTTLKPIVKPVVALETTIGKSFAETWNNLLMAKRMARQQQSCGGVNMKQRKSKFSMGQREAMREFGEGLGWSMRNKDRQEEINRFCERTGVSRVIFKTWLNNRKKCYFKGTSSANISS
ncbi:hypothetical protein GOBAR_DD08328 [Gossypium barbadense]|nr:hypothetical protein GOBAR_DD08328 [Gossypium barbadense]